MTAISKSDLKVLKSEPPIPASPDISYMNRRIKRTYTEIKTPEDEKKEKTLTKKCLGCKKELEHSCYTMNKSKRDDINVIYRNNSCKKCQQLTPSTKPTLASLAEENEDLRKAMKSILDALHNLATLTGYRIKKDSSVVKID